MAKLKRAVLPFRALGKLERVKISDHYVYIVKAPKETIPFDVGQERLIKILKSI